MLGLLVGAPDPGLLPQAHPVRGSRQDRTRTSSACRCCRSTWPRREASSSWSSASSRPSPRSPSINPIWAHRPVPARPGVHRRPARLVHGLLRGPDPCHAGLGDQPLGPHARPGCVHPADDLPAGPGGDRGLPVHRVLGHRRQARAPHPGPPAQRPDPHRRSVSPGSAGTSCCSIGGGNDLWATHFHLSINAITWFVRIGFFVVPVLAFVATKRICLGLQRRDRDKVLHGRESGIIKRLPHGEFIEVHEPLGPGAAAHPHRARAVRAARDRPDGRRERRRAQGRPVAEAAGQALQGLSTARTARSPSRPSRSTRRSPAATATTDHLN